MKSQSIRLIRSQSRLVLSRLTIAENDDAILRGLWQRIDHRDIMLEMAWYCRRSTFVVNERISCSCAVADGDHAAHAMPGATEYGEKRRGDMAWRSQPHWRATHGAGDVVSRRRHWRRP